MAKHSTTGAQLQRGLKLVHLRLLAALADTGQITQAAAAIGLAQPAASRLLAEVEQTIGAAVHERRGRGIGLTEVGMALARRAQRVQIELDDAARDMAEIAAGGVGHVRIGAVTGPAMDRVLPALLADRLAHPKVTFHVAVATSDVLCARLLDGSLDIALGRPPEGVERDRLSFTVMDTEKIDLMVRQGHPIAAGQVPDPARVLDYEWILPPTEAALARAVTARLAALGHGAPRQQITTASMLFTLALLETSDAVAPLSAAVVTHFTQGQDARFRKVPVDFGLEVRTYGLMTRRDTTLTATAQRLVDLILHA